MKDKGRNKRGVPPTQVEGFSPDPSPSLDFFLPFGLATRLAVPSPYPQIAKGKKSTKRERLGREDKGRKKD